MTGGDEATAAGGGKERVAELPYGVVKPTTVATTDGDGGGGAAAWLKIAGDGGGLLGVAAALRSTRELGRGGKRKRRTRGSYL